MSSTSTTVKFVTTDLIDLPQIERWITLDPTHANQFEPSYWLTGNGALIAFCLQDDEGPTMYVRFDKEDNLLRLRTQFAPPDEVSKERTAKTILDAVPRFSVIAKEAYKAKGIIFETKSRSLASFMNRALKFVKVDNGDNDDYVLKFEEN